MKKKYHKENKRKEDRAFPRIEMWNLDNTFSAWLTPRLTEFIKYYAPLSTPEDLLMKYGERGSIEWLRILRKIKYSFECFKEVASSQDGDFNKIEEGLMLFGKYFMDLKCNTKQKIQQI